MKKKTLCAGALMCAFFFASTISIVAQGILTPPGAPAPTMKTLTQVEPRTLIKQASLPLTINASGSYYVTENLSVASGNAITITASQVTLDLNGFTISSTASPAAGIGVAIGPNVTDITILNGHIKGAVTVSGGTYSGNGFGSGISYTNSQPANVRVAGVSVTGVQNDGIFLNVNNSTVVESCVVRIAGGFGIYADSITHSSAINCGSFAIGANIASDCYGQGAGTYGVLASTANNCYGSSSSTASGSYGLNASSANNCYGTGNGGITGIQASNCYGLGSNGQGILVTGTASNCYGYSSNSWGVNADTANNCYGESGGGGFGVNANINAIGCHGKSNTGDGVRASFNASNCYGESSSGTGLYAGYIAIACSGFSSSGTGLVAYIGNSCHGATATGTAENINHPYNMP